MGERALMSAALATADWPGCERIVAWFPAASLVAPALSDLGVSVRPAPHQRGLMVVLSSTR